MEHSAVLLTCVKIPHGFKTFILPILGGCLRQVSLYRVLAAYLCFTVYEGGSICNENPFITPSTNALGLYAICQTKDHFIFPNNMLQTF